MKHAMCLTREPRDDDHTTGVPTSLPPVWQNDNFLAPFAASGVIVKPKQNEVRAGHPTLPDSAAQIRATMTNYDLIELKVNFGFLPHSIQLNPKFQQLADASGV